VTRSCAPPGSTKGSRVSDTLSTIVEILVYIAMAATVVVLFMGLGNMWSGGGKDRMRGNRLMRWRVGLQFVAIALLAILVFVLKK
jgi:hypothetical protein